MNFNITKRLILGFLVATVVLVTAIGMSIWKLSEVNTISSRIMELRTPTAQRSAAMLNATNASLAALKGYVVTGDQEFKSARAKIWAEVDKTRAEIDELSTNWTNPENIGKWSEFKFILAEFELAQARVEAVAHTEDELPATKVMNNEAAPLAAVLVTSITDIINLERDLPENDDRKKILGLMADTRGSFTNALASIHAFLLTGDLQRKQDFDTFWSNNTRSFDQLRQNQTLLSSDQLTHFKIFSDARAGFAPLPNKMFNIRVSDKWSTSKYLLTNEIAPRTERLINILLGPRNADGERIGGMVPNQQQLLSIDELSNSAAIGELLIAEWLLMLTGIILTLTIAYFVTRSIISPINAMTDAMERLSAGELDIEIPALANTDEIGTMAKAVAIFKANAISMNRLAEEELDFQKHALDEHSIVSIADVRGDITYVNDKFCAISGYDREELVGNNHRIVKSGEHPKGFFIDMWKTIAGGKTWQGEIKNIAKNGEYYWVKTTIVPNLNENGKPFQYVGIRTEITKDKIREHELVALSEDLTAAKEVSEKATATKSEFLAAMSHEIRTPMAGIIGMADLILDHKLEPQVKDWADKIRSSSNHLMKILNEILDQSKLDVGKISIDPVDFHLASFVKSTTDLFLPKIATKGLAFDITIDEAIPEGVYADPSRITQVLSNFLSNALKFTEKGSISVVVGYEPVTAEEFMLRFTILDSGIGISEEALKKLFAPFTQADNSTSRTYGGTGLGLSISKQLVELMGGDIGVSSVEGIGSKFWFTVRCTPAKSKVEPTNANNTKDIWQAARPLKILVAEDTDLIQEIIAALLEQLGHRATMVDNGEQAVDALAAEDFDLILMDIRMPVMDGIQATSLIRAMEDKKADIPIIALTADISAGNIKDYQTSGINAVCSKPIHLPELLQEIDRLVGENIHSVVPDDKNAVPGAPAATGEKPSSPVHLEKNTEPQAPDASFQSLLDHVSALVEQPPEPKGGDDVSQLETERVLPAEFAAVHLKYENGLVERCNDLRSAIDDLAENPTEDELMKAASIRAHTMKGTGGTFNYPLVTKIAHVIDEILKTSDPLAEENFEALDRYLQALSLVAEKKMTGSGGAAGQALLQGLEDFS